MHEDIVAAKSKLHSFELVSLNLILNIISSAVRKSLIISKNLVALVSKAKAVIYLLVIFIFHSKDCSSLCYNARTLNEYHQLFSVFWNFLPQKGEKGL